MERICANYGAFVPITTFAVRLLQLLVRFAISPVENLVDDRRFLNYTVVNTRSYKQTRA